MEGGGEVGRQETGREGGREAEESGRGGRWRRDAGGTPEEGGIQGMEGGRGKSRGRRRRDGGRQGRELGEGDR